jgi:hypothetical protein
LHDFYYGLKSGIQIKNQVLIRNKVKLPFQHTYGDDKLIQARLRDVKLAICIQVGQK